MTGPTVKSLVIAALAVVTTGAVGAALGLSGVIAPPEIAAGVAPVDRRSVVSADCIDGPAATVLLAGERVVAVARSEEGDWIGVRVPATSRVLWVPSGVLTLDGGEPDAGSLPVGGACPEVVIAVEEEPVPVPTEEPAPDPGPNPNPGPAPDTTAPTLGQPSATPNPVFCADPTTIRVTASDDRGVSRIDIRWSGLDSGSTTMTASGSTWNHTYVSSSTGGFSSTTTFRIQAFDAAGNASAERSLGVTVECIG